MSIEKKKRKMFKALALIALVFIGCVSARAGSSPIQLVESSIKQETNAIDWCPQCINTYDDLIQTVLDIILQYGILDSCGNLCDLVEQKSGSSFLGFVCMVGCDVLGIKEFIKLMEDADIDPIYYCEQINLCPGKKINSKLLFIFFSVKLLYS